MAINRLFRKTYKAAQFVEEEIVDRGKRTVFLDTNTDTADDRHWRQYFQIRSMLGESTATATVGHIRASQEGLFLQGRVFGSRAFRLHRPGHPGPQDPQWRDGSAERTAEAEHRAERLRALAARLTQAEQKERQPLAAILHGHLQQLLVGSTFHLGMLRSRLQAPQQCELLKQVDNLLNESLDASRHLTVDLYPPILQQGTMAQVLHMPPGPHLSDPAVLRSDRMTGRLPILWYSISSACICAGS